MIDVARHAGVSLGTVSNTLNNPQKVTAATRQRVLDAIRALDFVRNDAARSLAAGRSTTVGLVVADLRNSLFVDIARGAEREMARHGLDLMIADTDVDRDRELRHLENFERARVAGIILAPLDTPLAREQVLPVRSTPTVIANFHSQHHRLSSVSIDERRGGALAVEHLVGLGRRRLLFVGGPLLLVAVAERFEGATRAVASSPDVRIDLLETGGLNVHHGRDVAHEIIGRGPHTYDAIVAASDLLAIGMIQTFSTVRGFSVPDDLLVTGYDNNFFASEGAVPLTTVRQPGEEIGRVSAQLLLERIAGTPGVREVVLNPTLVARRSTLAA